ncbi:MAG: hypothetical protein JWM80_3031 [Cyanobacteria bacterium RYN_339]|nr:hypothetical protein [Cyanobacteria bacterium RYN_339]
MNPFRSRRVTSAAVAFAALVGLAAPVGAAPAPATPGMRAVQAMYDAWVQNSNAAHPKPEEPLYRNRLTPEFSKIMARAYRLGLVDVDPFSGAQCGLYGAKVTRSRQVGAVEVVTVVLTLGLGAPGVADPQHPAQVDVVKRGGAWLIDDVHHADTPSVRKWLATAKP